LGRPERRKVEGREKLYAGKEGGGMILEGELSPSWETSKGKAREHIFSLRGWGGKERVRGLRKVPTSGEADLRKRNRLKCGEGGGGSVRTKKRFPIEKNGWGNSTEVEKSPEMGGKGGFYHAGGGGWKKEGGGGSGRGWEWVLFLLGGQTGGVRGTGKKKRVCWPTRRRRMGEKPGFFPEQGKKNIFCWGGKG